MNTTHVPALRVAQPDSAPLAGDIPEHELSRRVRADKIRLLYRQSFQGVFSSLVAAGFWMALMWSHAARNALLTWAALLIIASLLRTAVFVLYSRRCTDANVQDWIAPYAATVLFSALIWGLGTVWVMPPDSFLHQALTYVFLVGLAGAALSAYGVFRGMTIAIVCAVLLPCTVLLLWRGERESVLLALAGVWFFLTTLRAIAVHNASVEESFRRGHQLAEAKRIAETQARTDSLTGLSNRRAFTDAAEALLKVAAREGRSATMMLIDIDDFKRINDNHGHATGDAALLHIARLLSGSLRASDVCGRLGGDEFAVLLPNTDLTAAAEVADKLRESLAQRPLPTGGGLPLTLSIGLAGDAFDAETLLNHADAAMYSAKRGGKNRIASAE
ncbi:MAG: GGDEF domain-containing protein [Betaproteobacteria bacterium]|nr:GGDEF domain-containing protein [Betaproteobacteria bacterium]